MRSSVYFDFSCIENLKKFKFLFLVLLFSVFIVSSKNAFAEDFEEDLDQIEKEIESSKKNSNQGTQSFEESKNITVQELSELGKLSPFDEVSVIQRRYMPKTGRFQLFGGLGSITNDPFFFTTSLSLRFGYYFSENWGLELGGQFNSIGAREAAKELREIKQIVAESLVQPQSYLGLQLMWVPIYGKVSWFNKNIIPFDFYFSGGYGNTKTQIEDAGTLSFSAGQIFALSKSISCRWDLTWNLYKATGSDAKVDNFNNLIASIGVSIFFPEAGYR